MLWGTTARSDSFEFDTAVARLLKRALVTKVFETTVGNYSQTSRKRPPKLRRFSGRLRELVAGENGPTAGLGPVS